MAEQNAFDASLSTSPDDFTPALQVVIARVRDEVALAVAELGDRWTVSARVPGADLLVIQSSAGDGLPIDSTLSDLAGHVISGTPGAEHMPADVATHTAVYADGPAIGAIASAADGGLLVTGADARDAAATALRTAAPPGAAPTHPLTTET